MFDLISGLKQLPSYGVAAVIVMLLYAVQSEIRFGQRARTIGPVRRIGRALWRFRCAPPYLSSALFLP